MATQTEHPNSGLPISLPDKVRRVGPDPEEIPPWHDSRLDIDGVRRIVEAVGRRHSPNGIDLQVLRRDLIWTYIRWKSYEHLGSDKKARARVKRVEEIAKVADALRTLLLDDSDDISQWAWQSVSAGFQLSDFALPWRKFLIGLELVIKAARNVAGTTPTVATYHLPRSTVDYIVANELSRVYEKHLGREANRSRNRSAAGQRKADGPFVRFAVAALSELGITNNGKPYKPETIATALTDVRAGRSRREPRKKAS
jgi:hypothetical protein